MVRSIFRVTDTRLLVSQPECPVVESTAKVLLRQAVEQLPDDATVEDAIERLVVLAEIERGIADADAGRTISHDEVRRRLGL